MYVLLLGGTGDIGTPLLTELVAHGHRVLALARSETAAGKLAAGGAEVLSGDLREPDAWASAIRRVDAVVHVAGTFTDDEGEVDRRLLESLISEVRESDRPVRFVYTGGCWMYGETGDRTADESFPLNPPKCFEWVRESAALLFDTPNLRTSVVHPAMTYKGYEGVLRNLRPRDGAIEVWGSPDTRWPMVHSDDLAAAYRLVLECGLPGRSYNAAGETSVWVRDMVAAVRERSDAPLRLNVRTVSDVVAEHGEWAAGPAIDQQMSAARIRRELGWRPEHTDVVGALRTW